MIVKVLYSNLIWILCTYAFTHDIHKRMTINELKRIFHVDNHNLVPSYDIIEIHHVQKRHIDHSSSQNKLGDSVAPKFKFHTSRNRIENGNRTILLEDVNSISPVNLKFNAFGTALNLSLVPNDSLFKNHKYGPPIFTVHSKTNKSDGLEYKQVDEDGNDEHIGNLYHDYENRAALLLRRNSTTNHLIVEGSVGDGLVIRPIPVHLIPDSSDDEMYLEQDDDDQSRVSIDTGLPIKRIKRSKNTYHHIVYRKEMNANLTNFDYELLEENRVKFRRKRSIRKRRSAPYTIYPEILVIVDYDGYRLHGGDNIEIKRYFISFWNGVDLRYKLLQGPKIRISIAGIIISRGRDATPYLENNKVGRDAIDSAAALKDMGEYLFRERKIPAYDIAVAITKYDMCRRRKGGRCTKGTADWICVENMPIVNVIVARQILHVTWSALIIVTSYAQAIGFAYVGGACVVNKRLKKVNSVAIIEDTGGFSGIIVAAHEVGHLLGAVHDGSPPPSYLGGPGAENCRWTEGFIMSDLRHTEKGFQWSACSVASFHHFLNGDTASCLYNTPHEENSLPRVLPGKLLSLDAQCFKDRGTKACFKDERVCSQLFCFDSTSGYCIAYRPAAEGSSCGDGQHCSNGKCITENENIIPDYSHHRPSYVRYNPETRF